MKKISIRMVIAMTSITLLYLPHVSAETICGVNVEFPAIDLLFHSCEFDNVLFRSESMKKKKETLLTILKNAPIQNNICTNDGVYTVFAQKKIDALGLIAPQPLPRWLSENEVANITNTEASHEQLFFCADKKVISNIGFGPDGYFTEPQERYDLYSIVDKKDYDYRVMRNIIRNIRLFDHPNKNYNPCNAAYYVLTNNCQGFCSRLRKAYVGITELTHQNIGDVSLTTLYNKSHKSCQSTTKENAKNKITLNFKFQSKEHQIGTWKVTGKVKLEFKNMPIPGSRCQGNLSTGKVTTDLVEYTAKKKKIKGYLYFDVDNLRFHFDWPTSEIIACQANFVTNLIKIKPKTTHMKFTQKSGSANYSSYSMHNYIRNWEVKHRKW